MSASLEITIKKRKLKHPAFTASGPPANNLANMIKAILLGWYIVTKTFCRHPEGFVLNTGTRLARQYASDILGIPNPDPALLAVLQPMLSRM